MARLDRFFVPNADLSASTLELSDEVLNHVHKVLRLSVGDQLVLLDGQGRCCRSRLIALDRRRGQVELLDRWKEPETALPIHLIQGLPKGDKLELVLQKGTELGITRFQPVLTERSVALPDLDRARQKQLRWQRIIQEAARQSQRSVLPEMAPLERLDRSLASSTEHLKLVLWEESTQPLKNALPAIPPAGVTLLVGPEGGLTATEVAAAEVEGFISVHLGPRILRTETAGLAVTGILQYLYGDFNRQHPADRLTTTEEEAP